VIKARLSHLARDVRTTTSKEVWYRGCALLQREFGGYSRRFPVGPVDLASMLVPGFPAQPESWRRHLIERSAPRFFFSPTSQPRYRAILAALASDPREPALLEGGFLLFGRVIIPPHPVDWHQDLQSGRRWPSGRPWWRTPVAQEGGDVRVVWELNRHRDLFVLGRAYWARGDERFAEAARARIESWLAANPPETGVNWGSNLEVAMRAISFVWALNFFLESPVFDAGCLWRLTGAIAASGRHIARHRAYSEACMPGNHVVGDAAALAVIALTLPELREAGDWRRRAIIGLTSEAKRQVTNDGTHIELAPSYQAFVWELFYTVARLAELNDEQLPELWHAVERLGSSLCSLATPSGTLPHSGDSDEAVGYDLDVPCHRIPGIATVAAARFAHPSFEGMKRPSQAVLWLEGPELWASGQIQRNTTAASALYKSNFAAVGRTAWRDDADWCFLRGGGASPHTHADALHFEVAVAGQPLLIDAGTGTYTGSAAWRSYFRGTRSHNTALISDVDQAIMHRSFRWVRVPEVSWQGAVLDSAANTLWLDAAHDGYGRLGLSHRRQVLWLFDWGWLVLDRITGRDDVPFTIGWLAAGEVDDGPDGLILQDIRGRPAVLLKPEDGVDLDLVKGASEPTRGWHSPIYGLIEPRWSVHAKAVTHSPYASATLLRRLLGPPTAVSVTTVRIDGAYLVRVRENGITRAFRFGDDSSGGEVGAPECVF